jgi:2-iminoacetate synthase ThiH
MSVLHPLTKVLLLHSVQEFLVKLKNAGLGSLPGTAAEV